jgi:hypothetical protein
MQCAFSIFLLNRRQEEEAKKLRLQGQNPDAGGSDGDFMSEAKDWAGELISGQTGTGRILVRKGKMP